MTNLTQIREYEVTDTDKTIQVNIPIRWLRKYCKAGDIIGLLQRPDSSEIPGFEVNITYRIDSSESSNQSSTQNSHGGKEVNGSESIGEENNCQ